MTNYMEVAKHNYNAISDALSIDLPVNSELNNNTFNITTKMQEALQRLLNEMSRH